MVSSNVVIFDADVPARLVADYASEVNAGSFVAGGRPRNALSELHARGKTTEMVSKRNRFI